MDDLNRDQRRARAAQARKLAAMRPETLTEIPRERWPKLSYTAPLKAWESRKYLAQLYDVEQQDTLSTLRLSVCRVTLQADGRWEENLTWDELMQVKRDCGFGDWYAIEVHPRDMDIVNVASMRHLWLLPKPLSIGWFKSEA